MERRSIELPAPDIGSGGDHQTSPPSFRRDEPPNWRIIGAIALSFTVLVAVFVLGQAAGSGTEPNALPAAPTAVPSLSGQVNGAAAAPLQVPTVPEPTPGLVDLLGEGTIVAEIDFGNRSRAAIWCRETVPGTSIGSTLSLLYFADSIRFGEQLIRYEEITQPWIPSGGRRGTVLETEGLGAGDFPAAPDEEAPNTVVEGVSDGSRCESCAPARVELGDTEALIGSCVTGIPLGAGVVYAVMKPTWPGQTPLALHASCGVTTMTHEGDRLEIEAEAPLLRGLHDARFPLPPMMLERRDGWLESDDLELLDWYCNVERSSQLHGRHLLRTEPERRISYVATESAIGEVGLHGPLAIGLSPDQCSRMTRAWWGRPGEEVGTGSPIADLLGLEPPRGHEDWFYTCQPR